MTYDTGIIKVSVVSSNAFRRMNFRVQYYREILMPTEDIAPYEGMWNKNTLSLSVCKVCEKQAHLCKLAGDLLLPYSTILIYLSYV
ncbi:hypothetical protein KUTeg_019369 [Tegillarca granosa]|uniref:Uncharacterized protein n=1 Tax=Tegillarca granosa TaxID=220873 RepID=A0ABQ9ECB4_TEGGR|nr:hypothetical protein KUTeg_019369 [Tegillarca granosa]